jgi:hypothetical protein
MSSDMSHARWIGCLLLSYLAFLCVTRVWEAGFHNCYEMLWACNIALLCAGIGAISPARAAKHGHTISHGELCVPRRRNAH